MTLENMDAILRAELKPSRYKHTLGVMDTARELADIYGADRKQAELAGLLHDNAKALTLEAMQDIVKRAGLDIDAAECETSALLHAPVGAFLAQTRFGVSDAEVIKAIRYHTTGRPAMSPLEAIVYIADIIEPSRAEFDGLDKLRAVARKDLYAALELGLYYGNKYVAERGQKLFARSLRTYEWVKKINIENNSGRYADGV